MGAWKMDGDGDEEGAEPGMVDARENRGGKGGKGGADVGLDGNGNGLEGLQVGPLGRRDGRVGRHCGRRTRTFVDAGTLTRCWLHVNWDSTGTLTLRLGVLLLCVPTATFDPRSFLYFVPVLTVRYFIGCTGVVSMTVVSRWTCMYSCWNYRDMSLGRGRSLGEART